jgi:cytochrome c5
MRALPKTGLAIAALLVAGATAPRARADDGEKIYKDICTACHDAKTRPLDNIRLSRKEWKEAVERMEGQGADVPSGKKLEALLDYLERTHGPAAPGAAPEKK